jgi:hypothetical protein
MPYIKLERREVFQARIEELAADCETDGEMNYAISRLIHEFMLHHGLCYATLNRAVGILECAKQEFVRQVVAPYEARKKAENGPVSELDTPTSEDSNDQSE